MDKSLNSWTVKKYPVCACREWELIKDPKKPNYRRNNKNIYNNFPVGIVKFIELNFSYNNTVYLIHILYNIASVSIIL